MIKLQELKTLTPKLLMLKKKTPERKTNSLKNTKSLHFLTEAAEGEKLNLLYPQAQSSLT